MRKSSTRSGTNRSKGTIGAVLCTLVLVGVPASGCDHKSSELSCERVDDRLTNTPRERYGSNDAYKFVVVSGHVCLKFVGNGTPPFGPFKRVSDSRFEYTEDGRGVHSVTLHHGVWVYSDSYVSMKGLRVDASELALVGSK